jgi:hypothetical protein
MQNFKNENANFCFASFFTPNFARFYRVMHQEKIRVSGFLDLLTISIAIFNVSKKSQAEFILSGEMK